MFNISSLWWVVINSVVSFVYLFLISKILGKKQIAQLEFIDYTVGISLGSISAEMATSNQPFYHFLFAMTIFFVLALFVAFLGRKSVFLKRLLKGKPSTLIYQGKINYKQVCRCNIDLNDLLSMLRERGFFDITKVEYAIFEPSGKLSVLPSGENVPATMGDLINPHIRQTKLANILVLDGKISYSTLSHLNKTSVWLLKKLKITHKKQLKQIALAVFDEKTQNIITHYKTSEQNKN